MKWKRTERVQDSGETERECVRDRAWERQEVVSVVKRAIGENVMGEIRVGLKG